jgi:hypothetical protein
VTNRDAAQRYASRKVGPVYEDLPKSMLKKPLFSIVELIDAHLAGQEYAEEYRKNEEQKKNAAR